MAKRRKRSGRKMRARTSNAGQTTLTHVTFGGKRKRCYGKTVKAGRGKKRVPRVFCANVE